jgi:hypothetical protein
MHALRAVAGELRGMSELIDQVMPNPVVQAIVLDLNPYWMLAHRFDQAGLDPNNVYRLAGWSESHWRFEPNFGLTPWFLSPSGIAASPIDLTRRYRGAVDLTRDAFGVEREESSQPYLARIVTRPQRTAGESEFWTVLGEIARHMPFPTIVETRAEPEPLLNAGDRCNAPGSGTIGGFVRDSLRGTIYGATCGHVAAPGKTVTSGGKMVGQCSLYSHDPFAGRLGGPPPVPVCRPNVAGVERLDMALIDLVSSPGANVVTAAGAVIQRGDPIDMHVAGATKPYEVGGVVVTSRVKGACFDRLFEVMPRSSGLLTPLFNAAVTSMPAPGDSGAWITPAGSTDWCGMLIAGEALMAYAIESDDLFSEAKQIWGLDLVLA